MREAYRALREVVAAKIGGTIEQANSIVAMAADLCNCALYGLGEGYIPQDRELPGRCRGLLRRCRSMPGRQCRRCPHRRVVWHSRPGLCFC